MYIIDVPVPATGGRKYCGWESVGRRREGRGVGGVKERVFRVGGNEKVSRGKGLYLYPIGCHWFYNFTPQIRIPTHTCGRGM